jgi:hypothetical protein
VTNARLRLNRRTLLKGLLGAAVASPLAQPRCAGTSPSPKPVSSFSPDDDQLLNDIERAGCCFFWEQANPQTGLVKDRCNARKAATDNSTVASIAATGFGLTALCIATTVDSLPVPMRAAGNNNSSIPGVQAAQSSWLLLSLG